MRNVVSGFQFFLLLVTLTACYQKDLDEFNKAELVYKTEIALPVVSGNLTLQDTIPSPPGTITMRDKQTAEFPQEEVNSTEGKIDELILKVLLTNNFPANGTFQVYITDNADAKIDSLLTPSQGTILAGSSGNPFKNNFEIRITRDRYNNFSRNAKNIVLEYTISTTSGASSFVNNKFTFYIGVRAKLKNPF
ncbi:MAG: hypothetical protein NZ529_09795 [Cytophagaceae bacterium]|nr:hypothetical protein [Cytophagaceae bacterium]MDW8457079.1 hypothetical protein [Cytophagaceae bacterium]